MIKIYFAIQDLIISKKLKNPSMLVLQYKFLELLSHFELCIQVLPIKYQYLQTGSYFGQIKKQTKIVS